MRQLSCGRRFWLNGTNPKRMYVLENVRDFVQLHNLQAGSTLSFYYAPDNRLVGHLHYSLRLQSPMTGKLYVLAFKDMLYHAEDYRFMFADMKQLFASAIVLLYP